jgi:acyl carrier protein
LGAVVSRGEILEKIRQVMMDVLDRDDLHLDEKTTARDVEGWDSLSHLRIVTEIEAVFGLRFQTGEIERFGNVGDMVGAIDMKLSR